MTTHSTGTADLLDQLRNGVQLTEAAELAADRIEQLEAALTAMQARAEDAELNWANVTKLSQRLRDDINRSNAATAASFEVAAREAEQFNVAFAFQCAPTIRALATPDQTAALDKLIAEAEGRVWERAERIARNVGVPVGAGDGCGTYIPGTSADAARAIPTIDPAAIREDALKEAIAYLSDHGHWFAIHAIRALIGEKR